MNAVGIVVEYNPFHKGHALHLEAVKEKFPEDVIVAVMSGDYVQRGEPAVISKERRAKQAIARGVDVVIEFPAFYSTQSAEIFARASVGILHAMNCKSMVFGSETNDMERLARIAHSTLTKEFNISLKKYLEEGFSYPTAVSKVLLHEKIEANDILGMEYLKAIWFWNSSMKAESILRRGAKYYEENGEKKIAGASAIRAKMRVEEGYKEYLYGGEELEKPFLFWEDLYSYFRYYLLFYSENVSNIQDIEVGLEQRIRRAAETSKDYGSFLKAVLTKRYTHARLQRVFLHILLKNTKSMTKRWKNEIPYIRILEFSDKGQQYLHQRKKEGGLSTPVLTTKKNIRKKISKEAQEIFFWNEQASVLYQWILEEKS